MLEQDDALKSAMARGGNKAIEVTTREMGARFTFVVYHVELSAEQVCESSRRLCGHPFGWAPRRPPQQHACTQHDLPL